MLFLSAGEPRPQLPGVSPDALAPAAVPADLVVFRDQLRFGGLPAALEYLNRRTSHRFTGVFRFEGDMLRNVHLVDKWDPAVQRGDDVPLASAYCAHLERTGDPLEVTNGAVDPRTPWMADASVISYCGAPILSPDGTPCGALCHFDTLPCEAKNSDLPLLVAAAALLYAEAAGC
jgi:hypothetical protein